MNLNYLTAYLLFFILSKYHVYSYYVNFVGSDIFPMNTSCVRVEMFATMYGEFAEDDIRVATGLLLWRDYMMKNYNGICVNGGFAHSCESSDYKCIEVVIWDIAAKPTADSEFISANIKTLVTDIQKRDDSQKPNIIVTPTSAAIAYEIHQQLATVNGIILSTGSNIIAITASQEDLVYNSDFEFVFGPGSNSYHKVNNLVDFISSIGIKSLAILVDNDTDSSSQLFESTLATKLSQVSDISVIKRCSGERSNPYGSNCQKDLDCPADETCAFPSVSVNSHSINQQKIDVNKWINYFSSQNVDGFYYLSSSYTRNIMEYIKTLRWLPKWAGVYNDLSLMYDSTDVNAYNTYWMGVTDYNLDLEKGHSGKYMGNTTDFSIYAYENFARYLADDNYDAGTTHLKDRDLKYIALGSHIGVTIQRLLEIATGKKMIDISNNNFFKLATFTSLIDVFQNSFSNCVTPAGLITDDICSSTISCPDVTYTCKPFETFFGKVQFQTGVFRNEEGGGEIVQMIERRKDHKKFAKVVYPTTEAYCKVSECSADDEECLCRPVYPANWVWITEREIVMIDLDAKGIPTLCFVILTILLNIAVPGYLKKRYKKKFDDFPKLTEVLNYSWILYIIASLALYLAPSTFVCNMTPFCSMCGLISYTAAFYVLVNFVFSNLAGKPYPLKEQLIELSGWCGFSVVLMLVLLFAYPAQPSDKEIMIGDKPHIYNYCNDGDTSLVIAPIIILALVYCLLSSLYIWYAYKDTLLIKTCVPLIILELVAYPYTIISRSVSEPEDRDYIVLILLNTSFGFVQVLYPIFISFKKPKKKVVDVSYPVNQKKQDIVKKVLEDPLARGYFGMYLGTINQGNLISFWDDAAAHEKIQEFDRRTLSENDLFKKYFEAGTFSLNLGASLNKKVKDKLGKNDPNVFNDAKDTIVHLVQTKGYYESFLHRIEYAEYRQCLLLKKSLKYLKIAYLNAVIEDLEESELLEQEKKELLGNKKKAPRTPGVSNANAKATPAPSVAAVNKSSNRISFSKIKNSFVKMSGRQDEPK